METKQDILFIAYPFPPIKAIGVFRSYYLAHYIQPYFNQVHVITTSNQKFLPKEHLDLTNLNINKAFTFDYRTLIAFKQKQSMSFSENL